MRILLSAALLAPTIQPAAAAPPSLQPGLYEISVQMEMKGMPMKMPASSFRHCITSVSYTHLDVDENARLIFPALHRIPGYR